MALVLSEAQLRPLLLSARVFDSRAHFPPDRTRTPERVTECYEFSIYDSDATVLIDGTPIPLTAGTWRFLPPGHRICSLLPYACRTVRFTLNGSETLPTECVQNEFVCQIPTVMASRMPHRYREPLDTVIRSVFASGTGAVFARSAALSSLLCLIREDMTTPQENSVVRRAEAYLKEHLDKAVDLETLGAFVGYHPLYFQRIFKEQTGSSPHEYLTDLRMRQARRLLLTTAMPVRAVAESCGYASVSHFNSVFKRHSGVCPLAFRKQNTLPV